MQKSVKEIPGVGTRIPPFQSAADVVFAAALSVLLGLFSASVGFTFSAILGAALLAAFGLVLFFKAPKKYVVIVLFGLFFGAFYYHLYFNVRAANERIIFNEKVGFSGVVTSEPRFSEKTQHFLIKLQPPHNGKVRAFVPQVPEHRYGDTLSFEGKIERAQESYLRPASFFPETELISRHNGFWLKEKLINLKSTFINQFRQALPPDSAALLSGLTFGWQSDFSKELKEKMSLSGTTHIVALSGYNITILVVAVATALGGFLYRRTVFYITALLIFFFVLMVGGEASVVRAALMGFLVLFAKEAGRIYSFRNAIALAAVAMALFDPTVLAFNIGFQLSFISLLGIVYLEPALRKFFLREPTLRDRTMQTKSFLGWRENALTTLSAQLAVAPLIIQNFSEISVTSLFANILILEFVPFTMFLGFLLAVVSSVFSYLGMMLGWLVNILLVYEIGVINFFAALRVPVAGAGASWFIFVVYYLALIGFILYHMKHEKTG